MRRFCHNQEARRCRAMDCTCTSPASCLHSTFLSWKEDRDFPSSFKDDTRSKTRHLHKIQTSIIVSSGAITAAVHKSRVPLAEHTITVCCVCQPALSPYRGFLLTVDCSCYLQQMSGSSCSAVKGWLVGLRSLQVGGTRSQAPSQSLGLLLLPASVSTARALQAANTSSKSN